MFVFGPKIVHRGYNDSVLVFTVGNFSPERLKIAFGPSAIRRHSSENSFHTQDESGSRDTSERKLPKLTDEYDDILLFMHLSLKGF